MKIKDVLILEGSRLADAQWLSRLVDPGLRGCQCLLTVFGMSTEVRRGGKALAINSGESVLLGPPLPWGAEFFPAKDSCAAAVFFERDEGGGLDRVLGFLSGHVFALSGGRERGFFKHLADLFASQSVFSMQAACHSLTSLLYELAENAAHNSPSAHENVYIERALELMSMRLQENLSLGELAEAAHISEAHFIRMFKRKLRLAPMKYYMRMKIHHAASLIIQGNKIKEVAERTGFYNEAHFSREFRKYMGIPPREYKPSYVEQLKIRHHEDQRRLSFFSSVLSDFIDAIPDLIFFKDTAYVYRMCNNAFCEYVGRDKAEIYGHTDFNLFPQEVAAFYRANDEKVMKSQQPNANEEWITYPDGRRLYVEAFKAPYFGPDQELLGLVAVSRDITGRSG
ncbi:PAS domain-containing protein [Desulfovibrio sp. OttesenSCG-928-C14]|nr:PAS domain-containing protein [Desulfovibrio sp. OttesenSCG-928-C14]